MTTSWITLASYEIVILALTVFKAIEHCGYSDYTSKSSSDQVGLSLDRQPGRSSFINIFYADGLSYNFFILGETSPLHSWDVFSLPVPACSIANIVVRYKATSEYINLLTSLQPVIHSVLTSRMMLHLRQSSVQNISAWRPSSIRFAEGPIGEDRDNGAEGQIDAQMDARSWFTEDVQRYG
ncbi:hypothetical protein VNI00_005978 [Paramarasmius palmivorus]|uniref:Uncharacterized protein n=1 Tax=Paramarasmius palmivorus TaxID=297713 RepID=A0AAW0DB06_9AGAR